MELYRVTRFERDGDGAIRNAPGVPFELVTVVLDSYDEPWAVWRTPRWPRQGQGGQGTGQG